MAKGKQYKDKKFLPSPEIAPHVSHKKKKKKYLLERRMSAETLLKNIKYYQEQIEILQKNEWIEAGKYSDEFSARKARRQRINQQESYRKYWRKCDMNEYRIREIEEEK
jgi:hypothetical protein